jgi:hypothetical protein
MALETGAFVGAARRKARSGRQPWFEDLEFRLLKQAIAAGLPATKLRPI